VTDHPSTSEAASRSKAVLFCPECGHESRIDGDWTVHEDGAREVYECPDCGATVSDRSHVHPAPAC